MFYQGNVFSRNGESDFQNAIVGVDSRQTQNSDSSVTPSDQDWTTEGGDISREYTTGTSPSSQEGSKSDSPSPETPSHQLHSVKTPSSRQRTSQACDKCRERKTKCSGHRPICLRCTNRGLICEYTVRESRARTQAARSRVAVVSDPPQMDYTGHGRPTPAHHSRVGGGRTNAFAIPTKSIGGNTATQNSTRPLTIPSLPAHSTAVSGVRNIPNQNQRFQQPYAVSVHNAYNSHPAATSNSSYCGGGGTWSMFDSDPFALNFDYGSLSCEPSLNTHDEHQTLHSAITGISLPQSSLRFDYDLSSLLLPSIPPLYRQQDIDTRPSETFPCDVNEDDSCYIPPYIPNVESTYFQGGFPNPIYHPNNSNSSTSTLSTTPMGSQLELGCATPSIPVDPAPFRDVGGSFSRGFDFDPPSDIRYPSPPIVDRTEYVGYPSFR